MPLTHIALALLVALIWGVNFVVIKIGVAEVPPLFLCALRFLFAALPAVFLVPRPEVPWRILLGFGLVLGVMKFGLLFTAIKIGMPAGLASLVLQLQAFFTIAFAFLVLGERPKAAQIVGGLVALAGVGLIASQRGGAASLLPVALTVAAAAMWGIANILTKRAGRIDMLAFVIWASLVPPLPLMALSLLLEGPAAIAGSLHGVNWTAIGAVAYLAYPTTVIGFGLWNFLLARHPAATVAPFSLLVPVFGLVSARLILGERLSLVEALGVVTVLAGLLVNVLGPRLAEARRRARYAAPAE